MLVAEDLHFADWFKKQAAYLFDFV